MSLQNINTYTYSPGFQLGQYHNAVLCISGNVQSLYLDGTLIATKTGTSNVLANYSTINQILIGCAGDKSSGFSGYLDDFRMYNYTLNPAQVSNLYVNRNIVAYYPFDNSLNGQTPNYATLNYDATLVGSNATISTTSQTGNGSLQLTNTVGNSQNYLRSSSGFSTSTTNGLSISLWFKTTGVSATRMRLFDLCATAGSQGILVDISGTNQIIAGYNGYVAPVVVTTDLSGLISYYSFNGTLKESVSNNINTVATNVTYDTIGNKTGIVCPATDTTYNASSTKYIINYNIPTFSLVASNGVSISVWFYPTALNTTDKPLFTLDCPESSTWLGLGYTCAVRSSRINMWVANYRSAGYAISSTASLTLSNNTWYHLVMLFDTTNQIKAYLNGSSIAVTPATAITSTVSTVSAVNLPTTTNRFSIGSSSQLTNNFTGLISKFAVYNRVLSFTEINSLYSETTSFSPSNFSGLISWLDAAATSTFNLVNTNQISTWADKSSAGNNATVYTNVGNQGSGTVGATSLITLSTYSLNSQSYPTVYFAPTGQNGACFQIPNITANVFPMTVFFVYTFSGTQNNIYNSLLGRLPFNALDGDSGMLQIINQNATNNVMSAMKGGGSTYIFGNSAGNTTTMKILTIQYNPSGYIFNINGSPASASNSAYQYLSNNTSILGDAISGPNGVYLSERIWYQGTNAALTQTQYQQVEGYLAWKWGLQSALPSTHPYSTTNATKGP